MAQVDRKTPGWRLSTERFWIIITEILCSAGRLSQTWRAS